MVGRLRRIAFFDSIEAAPARPGASTHPRDDLAMPATRPTLDGHTSRDLWLPKPFGETFWHVTCGGFPLVMAIWALRVGLSAEAARFCRPARPGARRSLA